MMWRAARVVVNLIAFCVGFPLTVPSANPERHDPEGAPVVNSAAVLVVPSCMYVISQKPFDQFVE